MTPDDAAVFAQIAVVTVGSVAAFVGIGLGAHRVYLRSTRVPGLGATPDDGRLARLEQAVDSIAVEVERISEGQRFTTRLLTERSGEGAENAPTPQLSGATRHQPSNDF